MQRILLLLCRISACSLSPILLQTCWLLRPSCMLQGSYKLCDMFCLVCLAEDWERLDAGGALWQLALKPELQRRKTASKCQAGLLIPTASKYLSPLFLWGTLLKQSFHESLSKTISCECCRASVQKWRNSSASSKLQSSLVGLQKLDQSSTCSLRNLSGSPETLWVSALTDRKALSSFAINWKSFPPLRTFGL